MTRSSKDNSVINTTFAVIGGGIAGVSCAEQLAIEEPSANIVLISASPLVKAVKNVNKISERLTEFDVEEESYSCLENRHSNCQVIIAEATGINSSKHEILLSNKQSVFYHKLCICAGAVPKVITKDFPYVIGIRDTETIEIFQQKLSNARRVLIVGNGGIATELVYEIENCEIIWAIKDRSVGATFFDAGAAQFFLPCLNEIKQQESPVCKRIKYSVDGPPQGSLCMGSSLGPDWSMYVNTKGKTKEARNVHVEYECELKAMYERQDFLNKGLKVNVLDTDENKWPVFVELTNGSIFGCDFIVSATGVMPNVSGWLQNNEVSLH
ncbi:pyridine nucleotide-disulfide oxidoreductase domain-containing protein 1-like [Stegodyphus dumicola]|uniref:pyridine nucleotide-disulfide oxidoreductase domain-containing protein 1-like n=1 Tax=Stegodyphus dumicola TaxID=202533 RepID=UPI0015A8FE89|nr:pyridine nucleotide-disulfide oxidoreductase domain-containing protein 1-like [Stegodyphus dumicola]